MKHISYFLAFVISYSMLPITSSTQFKTGLNSDKLLSRKRRFLIPQSSGWTLAITVDFTIPLELSGATIAASIPITYKFDDGRYCKFRNYCVYLLLRFADPQQKCENHF